MTSSPGPTPSATNDRCRAVVQFETATAKGAPQLAANSSSNRETSGPCVTQPERRTRATASSSSGPKTGCAMGSVFVLIYRLSLPQGGGSRVFVNHLD